MLKYPDSDLAMLDQPLSIEPIGLAVPAEGYVLHNLASSYFEKLEMIGALEALREKWFQDGTWLIEAK